MNSNHLTKEPRTRLLVAAGGLSVLVMAGVLVLLLKPGGGGSSGSVSAAIDRGSSDAAKLLPRDLATYGDETTLDEARNTSEVPLILPSTEEANEENLVGVFSGPGQTYSFVFPVATETSEGIRNPEVAVVESPWRYGTSSSEYYRADLERNPFDGKQLCSVGELDAVCIEARSRSDFQQANAAYVGVRVGDLEVQVTAGDSLDTALTIAESIVANSGGQ